MIKKYLKELLSDHMFLKLRNIIRDVMTTGSGGNLNRLGRIYKTDKIGEHYYTHHYMTHLKKFRFKKIRLLEIGIGGDEELLWGGGSLRMWKRYFPFGRIYGIDVFDKSALEEPRIKIFQGSQADIDFLDRATKEMGNIDIIIDDGSHVNEHVIETFRFLFPRLNDGGIYIVEDTQTSYWEAFGGDSHNLNNTKTTMGFFKNLADSLNYQEFIIPNYVPGYYDKKVISMHFYHNLIFIYKGNNNEKSNMLINNQMPDRFNEHNKKFTGDIVI